MSVCRLSSKVLFLPLPQWMRSGIQLVVKFQEFMESTDFDPWNLLTLHRVIVLLSLVVTVTYLLLIWLNLAVLQNVRETVSVVSSIKKSRKGLQTSLASSLGVKRGSTKPVVGGSKFAVDAGEQPSSCSSEGRSSVRRAKRGTDEGRRKKKTVLESD